MSDQAPLFMSSQSYGGSHLSDFKGKSEREIWDAFREGSRSALVHLYNVYRDELFTYGYQFSKNKEAVKDHIQELFLYLYKNAEKLGPTDSIKFYLYRSLRRLIAKEPTNNIFVSFLSKRPQGHFSIEVSHETLLVRKEEKAWQLLRLKDAINKLPLRQREIIYYFFYEGFSYKEIQSIMGYRDIQTVRNLQHRAIKALKEDLRGTSNYSTNDLLPLIIILFQLF